MHLRRTIALAGALASAGLAACKDVPFAPHWDADMFLPMSTKAIYLNNFFPFGFIPPSGSANVYFPPQQQNVDGAVKTVLQNLVTDPTRARTVLTLTVGKRTAISGQDTLIVAPDSASLFTASPSRIVFPISLAAGDTLPALKTDSLLLAQAAITMLQNAGSSKTPLWIQMRGQVTNSSASSVFITPADSISVKLTVTARIAVSR